MKLPWLAAYFASLVWSVVNPHDFKTARALIGFLPA
jgi:hypothetical protein